jgi:putative chitinase
MQLTKDIVKQIAPSIPEERLDMYVPLLDECMGDVNTPMRMAAFLAQVLHESGGLHYVKELASGEAYEGRKDLGNILPGDGPKYKGRGLIQITGRTNYEKLSLALYNNSTVLVDHPALLEAPGNAVRSAYWFWNTHKLNELADAGDLEKITRRINGGLNGWAERSMYYERALKALGVRSYHDLPEKEAKNIV